MPFLARPVAALVDEPWALQVPATLASAVSVLLVALIARELGGSRGAQALAAWGYAFSAMPLMLGHLLQTSTCTGPVADWSTLWPRFRHLD